MGTIAAKRIRHLQRIAQVARRPVTEAGPNTPGHRPRDMPWPTGRSARK